LARPYYLALLECLFVLPQKAARQFHRVLDLSYSTREKARCWQKNDIAVSVRRNHHARDCRLPASPTTKLQMECSTAPAGKEHRYRSLASSDKRTYCMTQLQDRLLNQRPGLLPKAGYEKKQTATECMECHIKSNDAPGKSMYVISPRLLAWLRRKLSLIHQLLHETPRLYSTPFLVLRHIIYFDHLSTISAATPS